MLGRSKRRPVSGGISSRIHGLNSYRSRKSPTGNRHGPTTKGGAPSMVKKRLLSFVFIFGCTSAVHVNESTDEKRAAPTSADLAIQKQLKSLPHWISTSLGFKNRHDFSVHDVDRYKDVAINLQKFSVAEIKSGVIYSLEHATDGTEFMLMRPNIFVLLRFIFNVPKTIDLSNGGHLSEFSSFSVGPGSNSFDPRSFKILWPVDFSGPTTKIANFMGAFGGGYDPLEEIKLFSSYGYRSF